LSIAAEIVALRRGGSGVSLRDAAAIHYDTDPKWTPAG
jgi:xanthine/CO dehydrogenase XdhC/CoxF family maturation factor